MTFSPPMPSARRSVLDSSKDADRRQSAKRPKVIDLAATVVGIGLGASVVLPLSQATVKSVTAPGGPATLAGDVSAMAGTYLLLVMVLLAARIPALERVLGQDGLIRWRRRLSWAPLLLLSAHGVLTTLGYAQSGHIGFWSEGGSLITTMSWILASVVAYTMLVLVAGVSIRAVRRKFSYDTWWVIHLYTYLAVALSVPHQIFDGTALVGHPVARTLWMLLWLGTAGVVVYRIGLPVARSLYHRLEVVDVRPEGPGVYSLVVRGHHLDRLAVAGGQYFGWRFLVSGMWWHAHPFSLSALPLPPYMRVTIKASGDTTSAVARLSPGTRIAVEGPYGAFTNAARTRHKIALVGAGVGITPLRALLEDLPLDIDVVVLQRASTPEQMIHHAELASMVGARHGRMVELVGSRTRHRLDDPRYLHRVVPDLASRDLYLCGPDSFSAGVAVAAESLGVAPASIHRESFDL
ncbi:MAG: ferredoxin reductase family protein [Actinomycetota bacterium]|nr:ferredoxin reductase family protein [Actinomycetota bacterium]